MNRKGNIKSTVLCVPNEGSSHDITEIDQLKGRRAASVSFSGRHRDSPVQLYYIAR